jgi:hypothetical protein
MSCPTRQTRYLRRTSAGTLPTLILQPSTASSILDGGSLQGTRPASHWLCSHIGGSLHKYTPTRQAAKICVDLRLLPGNGDYWGSSQLAQSAMRLIICLVISSSRKGAYQGIHLTWRDASSKRGTTGLCTG